jgi:hypothetical protein
LRPFPKILLIIAFDILQRRHQITVITTSIIKLNSASYRMIKNTYSRAIRIIVNKNQSPRQSNILCLRFDGWSSGGRDVYNFSNSAHWLSSFMWLARSSWMCYGSISKTILSLFHLSIFLTRELGGKMSSISSFSS